jgi:hypothetical protein
LTANGIENPFERKYHFDSNEKYAREFSGPFWGLGI